MKKIVTLLLATVIAIPSFGQTSPKPPSPAERAQRQVRALTTLLSLTSAQQQQATTIYVNAAKAEQAAHQSQKDVEENLHSAIKNNDTTTIDEISSTLAQSMAQLTSIKAKADAAFYQILSTEQQSKFSDLESQHLGGLDGPGGPGGPPAMGYR
jgi:Spy/CpxP family protein refolding chaperone